MIKINSFVIFISLILCGLALYCIPLQSKTFYYDDHYSIESSQAIKKIDLGPLFDTFNTRFLVGLSFALNYKFGGLHPEGYRLVNLLIHCLNAFLVYLLLRATCRLEWPSVFGSFLFLCHPIQTEPVNFVTQRFVLMASFFYLLTVLLYIQYRKLSQKRYLFAAISSAIAAMFCKEFVITLPVMLGLCEFYFLGSFNEPIAKRFVRLAPFFLIVLIVPLLLLRTPPDTSGVAAIVDTHDITRAHGGVSRHEYFLTELNVLCTYVRLMFLPVNQNLDYDYPLSPSLDAKTALSGILLLCLLAVAWMAHRRHRMVSFGILWFFIALSVESSIIPIGHVIAEYRLYLASVGFIFLFVGILYTGRLDLKRSHIIAAIILAGFSILTLHRNLIWKDEITLWNDTIKKSPYKARPYNNRGVVYTKQGHLAQAIADYSKSIAMDPQYAEPYNNRGCIYSRLGDFNKAIADFNKAIEIDPDFGAAYYSNRAFVWDKEGDLARAIADYDKTIGINPRSENAYNNRGIIYAKEGKLPQAITDFNKALEIDPEFAESYGNRGFAYDKEGNVSRALADYTRAIELKYANADTYYRRALIYDRHGSPSEAMSDYDKAIALDPRHADAYDNRGVLYERQGRLPQAMSDYNKALELKPANAEAYTNRGVAFAQQGNFNQAISDFKKAAENDPEDAQAYNDLGSIYSRQNDFTRAILEYTKALALNPHYADAYHNRGIVHAQQGDWADALSDYSKTIAADPQFTVAYYDRAVAYYELKKFDEAWADVHKVESFGIKVNPAFISALKKASGTGS